MAEILDTFCERCGKAAVSPLAKAPASPKGLRRLLTKGSAKVETPVSALRLCLGCRGYVCDECWNEPASVCQSCQPLDGANVTAPTVLDQLMSTAGYEVATDREGISFADDTAWSDADDAARLAAVTAWPETDLRRAADNDRAEGLTETGEVELPIVDWNARLAEPAESQAVGEAVDGETAELAPEVEQALAAADQPAGDEFEDRWAELVNRVQAVGVAEEDGVGAQVVEDGPAAESEPVAQSAGVVEAEQVVEPDPVADSPSESWLTIDEQFEPESLYFDETALAAQAESDMGTAADEQPEVLAEVVEDEPAVVDEAASDEDFADATAVAEAAEDEPTAAEDAASDEEFAAVAELAEVVAEPAVVEDAVSDEEFAAVAEVTEAAEDEPIAAEDAAKPNFEDPAYVESRWQAQAALSEILENLHEVLEVAVGGEAAIEEPVQSAPADPVAESAVDETLAADEPYAAVAEPAPVLETESIADDEPAFAEDFLADEQTAIANEPAHVAEATPVAELESGFSVEDAADEWTADVDQSAAETEPAVDVAADAHVEPETAVVELVAAPDAAEEVVESAVTEQEAEPAVTGQEAEPAAAQRDPEEDLWAAVLADTAEPGPVEHDEPDRAELAQVLRPRRVRQRIVRQTRRPVQPSTASNGHVAERPTLPPPPPPAVLEVPAAPAAPPRTLRLPPVLPPRPPAQVSPWDMPAPPAFLPPPPPAMLSNVQPAPARFRPQVAVAAEPAVTMPTTRPCGNCGLELSAKVAFCRRCGTRQAPSA